MSSPPTAAEVTRTALPYASQLNDYVILPRIEPDDVVLILHVVYSSRDIVALFGH
jgi:hypothetical protein